MLSQVRDMVLQGWKQTEIQGISPFQIRQSELSVHIYGVIELLYLPWEEPRSLMNFMKAIQVFVG